MASVFHGFIEQCAVELGGNADLRARLAIRVELAFRIRHQIHDIGTAGVHDLAAFRRELLETIKHGGDHFTRVAVRHPVDLTGAARPVAQLSLRIVGKRTNDRDTLRASRIERQRTIVLQQCHGFASHFKVELLMLFGTDHRIDTLLVGQARIFEQSKTELQCENTSHGSIDQRFVKQTGLHGLDRTLVELWRGHHQVVAGLDRVSSSLCIVRLDLLLPHGTSDVVPIGDKRTLIVPSATQPVGKQPLVEGDRHAFYGLIAEHEGATAFLGHTFERRQEPRLQLAVAQIGFGSVTTSLGFGIAREMLGACENRVFGERLTRFGSTLISLDDGRCHFADQVRIFTKGFAHTTPTGVSCDAQHRGERPVHAGG